jgi:Rps23 Pro-64 3,4-dihydroxylase Tpa1-like proline 4-hydroxylase
MKFKQKEEYNKLGYTIIKDFLPSNTYEKLLEFYNNASFKEVSIVREERYNLWQYTDDKNFPSTDEIYTNNFYSSFDVVDSDLYRKIFNENIKPLFEELLNEFLIFRHQATKIKNNGKDHMRCHYDDYMGTDGYIFFLTKHDWKYDWGGQLQIYSSDRIETVLPEPNKLILINHMKKTPHWVTPVNVWAKDDRNNIIGFCVKKGKELPDTWTGDRNDYAVY